MFDTKKILDALGGDYFEETVNVGDIVHGDDFVTFKFKKGQDKINRVKICEQEDGLFTMKFIQDVPRKKFNTFRVATNLKIDQLKGKFAQATGHRV